MEIIKTYSRQSLVISLFFMALLLAISRAAFYTGLEDLNNQVSILMRAETAGPEIKVLAQKINMILYNYKFYVVPVSAAILFLFGILQWIFLRAFFKKLLGKHYMLETAAKTDAAQEEPSPKKEKQHNDRRLYLYLISVLQREGRLLDFFSENLDAYEDIQVGAAVRNIHENCRKVINKALAPKAIIDQDEGEEVTVEQGFDPNSIKLTGNVTGEPPFKGLLKHRGWQTRKIDLPTFSSSQKSGIIAPAEVEVL